MFRASRRVRRKRLQRDGIPNLTLLRRLERPSRLRENIYRPLSPIPAESVRPVFEDSPSAVRSAGLAARAAAAALAMSEPVVGSLVSVFSPADPASLFLPALVGEGANYLPVPPYVPSDKFGLMRQLAVREKAGLGFTALQEAQICADREERKRQMIIKGLKPSGRRAPSTPVSRVKC